MRIARIAAVAVLFGLSCAHPPPLRQAKLDVVKKDELYRPFLWAQIAGERVPLLVDTGASESMLPMAFADAHHLRRGGSSLKTHVLDANGAYAVMRVLPDVPVQFEGEAAGSLSFLGNPAETHMGVLAANELLEGDQALVFDFPHEELRIEPAAAALSRLGAGARNLGARTCADEGLFRRPHRFAEVKVNGASVRLLIDTGADGTRLEGDSAALRSLVGREAHAVPVKAVMSSGTDLVVDDVLIEFAGRAFSAPLAVSYVGFGCGEGTLGMDVLRHCVLVWGAKDVWADCSKR